MIDNEDYTIYRARPAMRAMTYTEACTQARNAMCSLSAEWCNASCAQITAEVCSNPTLFTGGGNNALIREALCFVEPGPGPSSNTLLIVAGLVAVALVGVAVATSKKTVTVARLAPKE